MEADPGIAISGIAAGLAHVRADIAAAALGAGRDPASVTLVAVSKLQPEARLAGAIAACILASRPKKRSIVELQRPGVLVSVEAGARDEEVKSALIESGGDLGPTNALDVHLL